VQPPRRPKTLECRHHHVTVSQGFGGPRSSSSFSCTCICITNHLFSLTDTAASASAILSQSWPQLNDACCCCCSCCCHHQLALCLFPDRLQPTIVPSSSAQKSWNVHIFVTASAPGRSRLLLLLLLPLPPYLGCGGRHERPQHYEHDRDAKSIPLLIPIFVQAS
jgi:hypothetical protein